MNSLILKVWLPLALLASVLVPSPASAQVTGLSFRPLDAAYSTPLDRIVFISANPNQLHIYDPSANTDQTVALAATPQNVSLAPDGMHAAVGFSSAVAYIDLQSGVVSKTFANVAVGTGVVVCGSGYIYVMPAYDGTPISIEILTGEVSTSNIFQYLSGGTFDPAVNAVYSTENGLSPNSLERFDASGGVLGNATDQPSSYFSLFSVCGPLWISPDGTIIYSACGAVYRASTDTAQDRRYLGTLPGPFASLATSPSLQQIAVIPAVQQFSSASTLDTLVNLYSSDTLNPIGQFATTPFQVGAISYPAHGRWVFYNSAASSLFLVTQADSTAGLELDYAIEKVDLTDPNSCGASFENNSNSAPAAGGYGLAQVQSGEHCVFTATSNASWITLVGNSYGSGSGPMVYLVRPNLSSSSRTGTITMGSQTFSITQDAAGIASDLNSLSFNPVAAAYDKALDKIVMLNAAPNELHLYDPVTLSDQVIPLSYTPISLDVRPDGLQAAVGHDGHVSLVDLQAASVSQTFALDSINGGIALPGNGYFYAFPSQTSSWGEIESVQISTGAVSDLEDVYYGNIPRVDSTGAYLYVSGGGGSKLNISNGPASVVSNFIDVLGGNIWLSQAGDRLIDSTGNVYFTSPIPSQDLQPDGKLDAAGAIDWAADSEIQKQIAVLTDPGSTSNTELQLYSENGLQVQSQLTLPGYSNNGTSYVSHGKYLFWNSGASKLFAITQADLSSGLLTRSAVYTLSAPESAPPCTYSVSPSPLNVPSFSSSWSLNVTSNCSWMATSSSAWITLDSSEVSGNGQITLSVESNNGPARSATVAVGNQTVAINQASSTCTYSLNTQYVYVPPSGGTGTVSLTTGPGCPWSAESESSWVTIQSAQSGTGPAIISFSTVSAGSGQAGSIVVAGLPVNVDQTSSAGSLQALPSLLTLPTPYGGSNSVTTTLYNVGITPVTLDSLSVSGPFTATTQVSLPYTIGVDGVLQVTVTYRPTSTNSSTGALLISSSAGAISVDLVGNMDPISPGNLSLLQGMSYSVGWGKLVMQNDGNLVLYNNNNQALWNSGTGGQSCSANRCTATFQYDGNLVVYNGSTPIWSTGTSGHYEATLLFSQTEPYMQMVDSTNGTVLWRSSPAFPAGSLTLSQGSSINFGESTFAMQGDGNLVLYQAGTPIWFSGTGGHNCGSNQCVAVFQSDGNLVVYDGSTALWNTGTGGNPGATLALSDHAPHLSIIGTGQSILWTSEPTFEAGSLLLPQGATVNLGFATLAMQGDGNLVLYQGGKAVWYTGTGGQNCGVSQCEAVFQSDGNLVVYNGTTALWSSGTGGIPGSVMTLSPKSPYLEIDKNEGILWSGNPIFAAGNLTLEQGGAVSFGSYTLVMQGDGNLVLYRGFDPVWYTGTGGQNCRVSQCQAVFQSDGNLVVYNRSTPIWASGTGGDADARLVLSPQGTALKIENAGQTLLWGN